MRSSCLQSLALAVVSLIDWISDTLCHKDTLTCCCLVMLLAFSLPRVSNSIAVQGNHERCCESTEGATWFFLSSSSKLAEPAWRKATCPGYSACSCGVSGFCSRPSNKPESGRQLCVRPFEQFSHATYKHGCFIPVIKPSMKSKLAQFLGMAEKVVRHQAVHTILPDVPYHGRVSSNPHLYSRWVM